MSRSSLYPPSVDPGFPTLKARPEGWLRTTFADIVEVVERPVKLVPDRVYKLVTAKRSRGGIVLRSEMLGRDILTKTQFEIKAGDFIISRRQIIHGACGIVPEDLDGAVVSNEYSTLRPRPGLCMEFLRHYSYTPYFQRTCFHSSHGVDVEKMIFKIEEWLARSVDLPPLAEQRTITAILSAADDAIESTQAVVNQLQVVKKAMMAGFLSRGLPGRHTRFKQTAIGELPESWHVAAIAEIAETGSGGTPSRTDPSNYGGEIPWVKSGEVDNAWIDTTEETLTDKGLRSSAARWVEPGSTLVAMYGATAGKVGRAGIKVTTNQAVCALTVRNGLMRGEFLYWLLLNAAPSLLSSAQGSGQPNLNAGMIRSLKVAVPPLDEQNELAELFTTIEQRIVAECAETVQLQLLKASLSSVLLTGDIRVTPVEATI